MNTRRRLPDLSVEHLWPLATLFVIFFFLSTHPVRPHDFWWHLRAGEQIVTTGSIPEVDAFSFTMAGKPYDSYASFWLVESAYYLLHSLGGLPLLIFLHALIITAAYGLVLWLCRKSSGSWRVAAAGTFFAAVLGFNDWNLRPQGVAILLGALFLWAIYEYRRRPRAWLLAIFPMGMLLWANSHGSFIVGFLLLAIWLLDESWQGVGTYFRDTRAPRIPAPAQEPASAVKPGFTSRGGGTRPGEELPPESSQVGRLPAHRNEALPAKQSPRASAAKRLLPPALALATAALACLANPRGLAIIAYLRSLSGNPVIRNLVTEWAAPSFRSRAGALFLAGLLLVAVLLAVSPRRPGLFQILCFLAFAVLGLQGVRFGIWFGLVMAPIVAEHLSATVDGLRCAWRTLRGLAPAGQQGVAGGGGTPVVGRRSRRRTYLVLNWLLAGALLAGAVLATPWLKHVLPLPPIRAGLVSMETPVEATRFLQGQRLSGRLFHELGFGSYLIWAAPEYPVFVDPRIELYPPELWRDYQEISAADDGWEQRLEEYGVNTLMLSPVEQPLLLQAAEQSPGWQSIYRDPAAALLVRVPRQDSS